METVAQRIDIVRERILRAAQRVRRSPDEVRLIGVTKTHPPEVIAAALAAGLADFGENRIQEAESKITALAAERDRITWHLIGHLQSNKSKRADALFNLIHTVDSLRLAQALDRHAASRAALPLPTGPATTCDILIQVNVSGEVSKEGFALAGWQEDTALRDSFLTDVERLIALPHLRVLGLMTIAPWGSAPEAARPYFSSAQRLRELLARRFPAAEWGQLSMGMTDDFEVAIEEGATIVRVGRALFGAR